MQGSEIASINRARYEAAMTTYEALNLALTAFLVVIGMMSLVVMAFQAGKKK